LTAWIDSESYNCIFLIRSSFAISRLSGFPLGVGKVNIVLRKECKRMSKSEPSTGLRYGVAVLSVVVTLIALGRMEATSHDAPHVSLLLCAVMFAAWFGGVRPGLLAIALAIVGFKYFFLSPIYSFNVDTAELPRLLTFSLSALFVGGLSAAQKSATESLRRARDEQRRINQALQTENLERRRAEDALRASEQVARGQIDALAQNLDILATTPKPESLIGQMLSTIGRFLNAQSVIFWLLDEPRDALVLRAAAEGENFAAADANHPLIKDPRSWKNESWIQEMFFTGAPAAVEAIEGDPRVSGDVRDYFRSKGTTKFLGIPTLVGGDVKGFIAIRHTARAPYRPEEIELAQALAHQAMFAVQLDQFAEHGQQAAILEERNRMARDIHDTLAQGFTGVIIQLEAAEDATSDGHQKEADKHLHRAAELARQSLIEARRSVHALRPDALERANFWEALKGIIKSITAGTALQTTCELRGKVPELPRMWQEHLLHIGQEALTNALRYANARNFQARLRCNGQELRLELSDDGAGFELTDRQSGLGLTSMRERVQQMNGTLQITSAQGKGTTVVAAVPINKE
jgi:signal transduction histidine kinase